VVTGICQASLCCVCAALFPSTFAIVCLTVPSSSLPLFTTLLWLFGSFGLQFFVFGFWWLVSLLGLMFLDSYFGIFLIDSLFPALYCVSLHYLLILFCFFLIVESLKPSKLLA